MKKLLFLFIIFISIPVYSACLVDTGGETVCSLSNIRNNTLQNTNNQSLQTEVDNLHETFKPIQQNHDLNKPFPQTNNPLMQYNSGCQFGICVQDLNNVKNPNQ